ncbi:hypothetical protein C3747_66g71 [Trypanosoma cruzi]|uniref:Uncharacterized protein n=2 Tax=Trypanosoma cruzi TaxID=5693 RepID=Q4CKG1_TRYCC|nr:hypothetical protein, conserved [Trypanosoma cruzi]EAN80763.1 hypothetical protein, conserved [Trypanosoma cruzi]PWV10740.1 hypothetical protein C3747_66g71 [Trypanosoma cruzi]RNC37307.1 hypothetical protein TcCL_NonESM13530 [Trypanosoma cruzi]|eukprot:XP_802209.1 hypothetical protein [Trypanosoma cruzi strain CL Brener]
MELDCMSRVCSFLRKFLSVIMGILLAIFTLLYVIGAGRVITLEHNFKHAGFAYFLGIFFSIITVICYISLHFVPRKAYRLLYFISVMLVLSMFFVAHSMGLAGPVVSDCNLLGLINYSDIVAKWRNMGTVGVIFNNETKTKEVIGKLGEPVQHCVEQELTFATALIMLILQVFALFDVQKVLLTRVRSKTYGERFVEMGISN